MLMAIKYLTMRHNSHVRGLSVYIVYWTHSNFVVVNNSLEIYENKRWIEKRWIIEWKRLYHGRATITTIRVYLFCCLLWQFFFAIEIRFIIINNIAVRSVDWFRISCEVFVVFVNTIRADWTRVLLKQNLWRHLTNNNQK